LWKISRKCRRKLHTSNAECEIPNFTLNTFEDVLWYFPKNFQLEWEVQNRSCCAFGDMRAFANGCWPAAPFIARDKWLPLRRLHLLSHTYKGKAPNTHTHTLKPPQHLCAEKFCVCVKRSGGKVEPLELNSEFWKPEVACAKETSTEPERKWPIRVALHIQRQRCVYAMYVCTCRLPLCASTVRCTCALLAEDAAVNSRGCSQRHVNSL